MKIKKTSNKRQFSDAEIDLQYNEWQASQNFSTINEDDVRTDVDKELKSLRKMPVEEYTFWRKWNSIQNKFPGETQNTLFGSINQPTKTETLQSLHRVKNMIWMPQSVDDYMNLEPELYYVNDSQPIPSVDIWGNVQIDQYSNPDPLAEDFRLLRRFISSAEYGSPIGRSLNFLVRDKNSKQYLGTVCISGDFMDLKARDDKIGWTREYRTNSGKLNNTANGSTIVPTQPLGHNYVGGKLLALLCLSEEVQKLWRQKYGDTLVGVSTTALYGKQKGATQYSSLKHWKSLGHSAGSVPYKLSYENEQLIREWMRVRYPREYWNYFVAKDKNSGPMTRDATTRSYQFCYQKLGFKPADYESNHDRGVYFGRLYQNTDEFLRGDITEKQLKPIPGLSTNDLVELWKNKYAKKRIANLQKNDAVSQETLFQDDLIGLDWKEAKSRHLCKVGR